MSVEGPIARLIDEFAHLPGVGPKTAQRLAYWVLRQDPERVRNLARSIVEARQGVKRCSVCQDLTDRDPCRICSDPGRDRARILVVEEPKDLLAVERTHEYKGLYHVLGGAISPIEGIGPEELRIRELIDRLRDDTVKELILATDPDVEGDATALYLSKALKRPGLDVTRIARGLPVGGDLDFADEVTLVRALEGRTTF